MNVFRRMLEQLFPISHEPERMTRGRIRYVDLLANGDLSVVVAVGTDERQGKRAKLQPGALIECRVVEEPGRRPQLFDPTVTAEMRAAVIRPLPGVPCDCFAPGGYPHEPDCLYWEATRYDQVMGEEFGKPVAHFTPADRTTRAMMEAHERTVARLNRERADRLNQAGGRREK